jgi:hypothetical protein
METFRQDTATCTFEDLLERYAAINGGTSETRPRDECDSCARLEDVHSTLAPRGIDEFVTIAGIFVDLLSTASAGTLQSDSNFRLSEARRTWWDVTSGDGWKDLRELLGVFEVFKANLAWLVDEATNLKEEGIVINVWYAAMVSDTGTRLDQRWWIERQLNIQVMLILRYLAITQNVLGPCLSVVGEVEKMDHVALLFLNHLPAEVDDVPETQSLMVLFPTMADKHWIGRRKGYKLELCVRIWVYRCYKVQCNWPGIGENFLVFKTSDAMCFLWGASSHST